MTNLTSEVNTWFPPNHFLLSLTVFQHHHLTLNRVIKINTSFVHFLHDVSDWDACLEGQLVAASL